MNTKRVKIHKRKELCQSGMIAKYHTVIRVNDKDFEYTGDKLALIKDILIHLGHTIEP